MTSATVRGAELLEACLPKSPVSPEGRTLAQLEIKSAAVSEAAIGKKFVDALNLATYAPSEFLKKIGEFARREFNQFKRRFGNLSKV
jgi:hypothetical protein